MKSQLRTGLALACIAFFLTCSRAHNPELEDLPLFTQSRDLLSTELFGASPSYGYYPPPSYYYPPSYGSYGTYEYTGYYGEYTYGGYPTTTAPVVYYSPVSPPSTYGSYGGYAAAPAVYYVQYGQTPVELPKYGYYSSVAYGYYQSTPTPTYYGYYSAPVPEYYGYYSTPTPEYYGYYPTTSYGDYGYYPTTSYGYYGYYTTPTYYYTPASAPYGYTYFGEYSSYGSYGSYSTPSSCPTCPVCDAQTHASVTTHESGRRRAVGQCYCSYDHDWRTWAVADTHCRIALFERCDKDSRLRCSWLDEYFRISASGSFSRPHEQDIYNYLYSDCPPAEPCSCSSLNFDGRDDAGAVYTCCKDLQVFAEVPFSGLSSTAVDAFCSRGTQAKLIQSWVQHALWHASCPASQPSKLYTFVSDKQLASQQAITSEAATNASKPLSASRTEPSYVVQRGRTESRNAVLTMSIVAGAAGMVGGATIAAVVMLLLNRRQQVADYLLMA